MSVRSHFNNLLKLLGSVCTMQVLPLNYKKSRKEIDSKLPSYNKMGNIILKWSSELNLLPFKTDYSIDTDIIFGFSYIQQKCKKFVQNS